jgi:uncharacterized protein with HEPN domain
MRTILTHEYHRLDEEIVESTVAIDLPDLVEQIEFILTVIH